MAQLKETGADLYLRHSKTFEALEAAWADKSGTGFDGSAPDLGAKEHVPAGTGSVDYVIPSDNARGIVYGSRAMREAIRKALKLAPTNMPVLIFGERGTGKELFARLIHAESKRNGPFVGMTCASLAGELMESELFGHSRGAFTGAIVDHKGYFATSNGGTLFIDEVGDVPVRAQAALLRTLQEREFRPVGSQEVFQWTGRVVSATNKHLPAEIEAGRFRADLHDRLNAEVISLPPLRERIGDIFPLISHFLREANKEMSKAVSLTPAALAKLTDYTWPGNVRELQHKIQSLVALAEKDIIEAKDIFLAAGNGHMAKAEADGLATWQLRPVREMAELNAILRALAQTRYEILPGATLLGLDRNTLYHKLAYYGLTSSARSTVLPEEVVKAVMAKHGWPATSPFSYLHPASKKTSGPRSEP